MAEGKWIEGLTPDTPAVDAARAVLAARLGTVRHYLVRLSWGLVGRAAPANGPHANHNLGW